MDNQSGHKLSNHWQCNPSSQSTTKFSQLQQIRQNTYEELERSKRKILLLEKNKVIANQQLDLYRQQMNAKSTKIIQLQRLLNTNPESKSHGKRQKPKTMNIQDQLQIIITEKDEQIHMLSLEIKQWIKKYQLILENQLRLEEQLKSKINSIDNIRQSINQQIHFYQQQIRRLQDQLQQKQISLQKNLTNSDLHLQKQKKQWIHTNSNLNARLSLLQKQMSHQKIRQNKIKEEYQKMKIENKQLNNKISQSEENVQWYKRLLEQTKLQFINAELLRQEQHQKMLKEKTQFKRNTQCFKEQVKMMKEQSTCVPSSVKSYRKSSTCSVVTAFRLTPEHSQQVSLINECNNPSE